MAANGKTLEYLLKEGIVRTVAENSDWVVVRTFTNQRGTQSTAAQTSEYAIKLSDLLAGLEESADITALEAIVIAQGLDITTLQGAVASLQGDMATAQGDIGALQGDVTTLEGRVDAIATNVYIDNAAALLGGLVAGQLYSTPTGEVRIVI